MTECKPYRYRTEAYLKRKEKLIKKKLPYFKGRFEDADSSSESDGDYNKESGKYKYKDSKKYKDTSVFWDQNELM